MNRWTDFRVGFGIALLLHALLVLGAVWFWALRPPELRPVFQGGDVSMAVTFVVEEGGGRQAADARRQPEDADILADSETEMPAERSRTADGRGQTTEAEGEDQDMLDAETAPPVSGDVPGDGRQAPLREAAMAGPTTESAAGQPSGALRPGVSGAVRVQSEIRPYYPLGARLRGEEGAVTVRAWVSGSGRALRCEVARSSGYPALDQAAVDAARRARYVAAQPGALRAEAETTLTFRFRLTE